MAAEWRITPRLTIEEAYNDNVDLRPKGEEESDFITSISPGVSVRGTGRRVSLNFDYDPEQLIFLHRSDKNELRQRFRGFGDAELVEQLLFLEGEASVNQQFVDNAGAIGGTTLTASENLETVQTYSIGPVLRNHLGSFADAETRYRYSVVMVSGGNVSDTDQHELNFTLRSGRQFTDLAWTFTANGSRAERSRGGGTQTFSGTTTDRRLVQLDTQYALNSMFSLLGAIGYEEIEDPTLASDINDPLWNVGFQVRPNSVSSAQFRIGERFGGSNYNVDVNYRPSPTFQVTAQYLESVQTSQSQLVDNLGQIGLDPSGGLVDTSTGRPFLPGDPVFGLTNAAFRQERFSLNFNVTSGRNAYFLQLFDESRDFDTQVVNNTEARGGTLSWNRRLTPLTTLNVGLSYSRSKFENQNREDDFYTATSGLSYLLSETAQVRLSYRRTQRDSNAPDADLVENFVAVTLSKSF